jgi:DNA modification methylase
MNYKITNANIKEWAKNYDGLQFDAILCDPPYELGFMGKSWDSSGIAFDKEMWADLFRHVKPGGHLLAFSGSRTYHRMAVAIEDAGFEIRDMIEWLYGSGFPKSLNIGKAVDKIQGNEREVLGERKVPDQRGGGINSQRTAEIGVPTRTTTDTKGTSPYEGYGTALKPAHEPCVLARKPLEKGMTVATNALKHGTGGLNIDGSRVGTDQAYTNSKGNSKTMDSSKDIFVVPNKLVRAEPNTLGRFPANLIHDGSDEVVGLFPDTKGQVGRQQLNDMTFQPGMGAKPQKLTKGVYDSGSAARFFYTAKASKSERNAGLKGFEEKNRPLGISQWKGQTNGSGEVMGASAPQSNGHPTVKPLSLTKYLATLIKPPTGGRLLVPFSGSGSEIIGALQAGWEYVEGVELTEEYIPIAEARIKYWLERKKIEETKLKQVKLV